MYFFHMRRFVSKKLINYLSLVDSNVSFLHKPKIVKAKEKDDREEIGLFGNDNLDQSTKLSRRRQFNFIADVVELVLPSIVQIEQKQHTLFGIAAVANGSGFIVDESGIILTNAHVVRDINADLIVKLNDGYTYKGRVVKIDKSADLAIVKIDCQKKLKPVKLGDSDQVRTGEFVVALGSPLTLNNTVTSGVVSNPLRDGTELGLTNDLFYIQTDTIVTHGNSGGPLVNLDGEVIGINSMTATPGISFAIPSKYASEFLDIRRASIASKYRYLGMKMISITPQINHLFNEHTGSDIKIPKNLYHGCLIIEVSPDSPAERASIRRGDVILEANGTRITKNTDLFKILKKTHQLSLLIIRNNQEVRVEVIADEREG